MNPRPVKSQQERLAALYEVSSRLGTTLDLSQLLNLVMDAIIQLTGAERGFLVLTDENNGELKTVAARSVEQETIDESSTVISRSIIRRAITSDQPILTDNAQEDSRFSNNQSVVGFRLRSIMCAPLRVRGKVIGASYVDNRLFAGVFSQDDLELLVAFANQAAIAIENARLFQQTDQALTRRVEELTLFQRIDQELNKSLDLNRVLSLALDWATTLTKVDGGSIGLMQTDETSDEIALHLLVYRGQNEPDGQRVIPAGHPILSQILTSQGSVQTRNVQSDQAIDGTEALFQLAVPIKREGQIIGLITLESQQSAAFREEDIAFVERLADRSAVAIENSRLYEAIRSANKAKNDFISLVTHELRVPMTSIKGYTDLLVGQMAGPLNDMQKDFLDTIRRNVQRMSVLIRDLSDINRIETGRMNFESKSFDLIAAIHNVASDLRETLDSRQQTLTLDLPQSLPPIHADRTRISQVLTNLISNANKYTPNGGAIRVALVPAGEFVEVLIIDNGIGISDEDQAKLFDQFFRSEDRQVREQVGWGLGLSIVKKLVEAQGGQVSFKSKLGEGSTFSFTVPFSQQ